MVGIYYIMFIYYSVVNVKNTVLEENKKKTFKINYTLREYNSIFLEACKKSKFNLF